MGTVVQTGSRVLVWVTCLLLVFPATAREPKVTRPEVDTPLGRVRGRQVGVKGTDRLVNVFLGIPFAQPPLGPLRFSAPLPAQPWEGVRDATTNPPMCLQDMKRADNARYTLNNKHEIFSVSEDCLILNIYTPAEAAKGAGRPVIVWIHGGSLVVGSATSQDGSALAAYGDVVVVTVQYRLGILGFLSTGDKYLPGNRGLLDVVAALQWVQGNIAAFGGDSNCVTILGHSAGSFIVSGLVLSPMSAGLFHRAISQSGVITSGIMMETNPWPKAKSFAASLDCRTDSSAELVQCLLQKKGEELVLNDKTPVSHILGMTIGKAQRRIVQLRHEHRDSHQPGKGVTVSYVVDDSFFLQTPAQLLAEKKFPPVPYLLGVNNHEFGWLISKAWGILDKMDDLSQENMLAIAKPYLTKLDVPPEMMSTVIDEYLDGASDALASRLALQELLGDILIVIPTLNFSRHLRDVGCPVFLYEFQHVPSSFAKFKPDWVKADHGSESAFVLGGPFLEDERSVFAFPEATEEEKQLSLTMMAQWAQFARTGDPNGKGLPPWPQLNQMEHYLEIDLVSQTKMKLKEARLKFWTDTLPNKTRQWHEQKKGRKAPEEL